MARIARQLSAGLAVAAFSTAAALAQSTTAMVTGAVRDEQQAAIAGAAVTVRSLDTNDSQRKTTTGTGSYRFIGLPPGHYELTVVHPGFRPDVERFSLTINQEHSVITTLRVAAIEERVDVRPASVEGSKTVVGRTIDSQAIESLPVPSRDFSTLAQLTPGVMINRSGLGAGPGNPGIAASGQLSRNNRLLVDGLLYDRFNTGTPRGGYPLDAVREFAVLTNSFTAEYGQAAGAILAVVTRSGTNLPAGRAFYFHRDDALDATPGSAKLAGAEKARLEQSTAGGFLGGPWRKDRAFYFGSLEAARIDNDWVVSSPALKALRPHEPAVFPNVRNPIDAFGRTDLQLTAGHRTTVRAHVSRQGAPHASTEMPRTRVARERTTRNSHLGSEIGLVDSMPIGVRGVNEARLQFSTLRQRIEASHCPACPTENRPTVLLGAPPNPQAIEEDFWQIADTLTMLVDNRSGQHTIKTGIDVIRARNRNDALINPFGTFRFATDEPSDTWPTVFEQRIGASISELESNVYAAFLQDEWKPIGRLTVNAGVRWDYVDALGISRRADNISPRLGVAFDPSGSSRTTIRGSVGRYYDSVYVQFTRNDALAPLQQTWRVMRPPYVPWTPGTPFVNPLDHPGIAGTAVIDTASIVTKDIPYTDQATVGIQGLLWTHRITADAVYARGRNLLMTRDQNYPLNVGDPVGPRIRPDPALGKVLAVESIGNSWHSALLIGIERHLASGHWYSIAYTWSSAERDTEQAAHLPFDHRNPSGDRGPSSSDVRHRVVGNGGALLPVGLHLTAIVTAESAAPYNITLGEGEKGDINRDGFTNDRPAEERRNSARGDGLTQIDLRLSKTFRWGGRRLDLLIDVFNATNHRNWTSFNGNMASATFGQPQNAEPPRQVQLGVRFDFQP